MLTEEVQNNSSVGTGAFGLTITVVMQNGDSFPFTITERGIADDVKAMVENITGTSRCDQVLTMDGHRVDSNANLVNCGVRSDSCVRVLYNHSKSLGCVKLRLRSLTAEETCLHVDPIKTVLETKEIYENLTGIPSSQLDFIYMGKIMENALSLLECNVSSQSIVYVVFKHITIFIGTKEHKFYCLKVHAKTTVSEIKARIYENAGIEVKEQKLVYKGKELEDEFDLAFYRALKPNGVFHLIVSGGKGGQSVSSAKCDDKQKSPAPQEQVHEITKKIPTEYCSIM
ncbi:uncharacterized protein LOC102805691 [Saccoglossus kowalevskii]|uniref:Uncharacterized protein LOC102805691 n=1 Tax=Saccoglossus kowalevskii TaxID=10224 RepID=A0ABM0MEX2_SACKO|nr:PREDICTED: uncharacterized protein LOC102805691 [Saccoglossus kowalevskii]